MRYRTCWGLEERTLNTVAMNGSLHNHSYGILWKLFFRWKCSLPVPSSWWSLSLGRDACDRCLTKAGHFDNVCASVLITIYYRKYMRVKVERFWTSTVKQYLPDMTAELNAWVHCCMLYICLHAQYLYKIKPVKIPSIDEGGTHGVPFLAGELLPTDGWWGRDS